eukprot:TRINITY_DN57566_c0_g1_i1.p1 TRINITY_DN57566_c0_g1~~TRINITY_DN57566_c0_g1_i1.p1  ORF type:complete len:502 (-),score=86.48 TRINITY_DN57566_c0_g1_i1:33-1487(-)
MKFLSAAYRGSPERTCGCTDCDVPLPITPCAVASSAAAQGDTRSRESTARFDCTKRVLDVSLPDIHFAAAHFVAYRGFRETLHGHNYTVQIRLGSNQLSSDGYVVDFGEIKHVARGICKSLHGRTLLPAMSDVLTLQQLAGQSLAGDRIEIRCEDGSYFCLPAGDCVLLPIVHSTAEELAEYVWRELVGGAGSLGPELWKRGVEWLEVTVLERPGQGASFREVLSPSTLQEQRLPLVTRKVPTIASSPSSAPEPTAVSAPAMGLGDASPSGWPAENFDNLAIAPSPKQSPLEVAEAAYRLLLSSLGPMEASRPVLAKTPARAAKAFHELTRGLTAFENPLESVGEGIFEHDTGVQGDVVAVRDIQFHSLCEHHLLPFSGVGHIAYVPRGRILGLSKFARLLNACARRPQVQERLSAMVADGLVELLAPACVLVSLEARHACMSVRGVGQPMAVTRTQVFRGPLKDDPAMQQQLLQSLTSARSSL